MEIPDFQNACGNIFLFAKLAVTVIYGYSEVRWIIYDKQANYLQGLFLEMKFVNVLDIRFIQLWLIS